MKTTQTHKFIISVAAYKNKGLNLALALRIQSAEEASYIFDALLRLHYGVQIEPDLCVIDADIHYAGMDVKKNTALPESELDFFQMRNEYYRMKEYSPIAQQLAEQVSEYLSDIMGRITFKIILNPEKVEQA